jgi:hypothetical protein
MVSRNVSAAHVVGDCVPISISTFHTTDIQSDFHLLCQRTFFSQPLTYLHLSFFSPIPIFSSRYHHQSTPGFTINKHPVFPERDCSTTPPSCSSSLPRQCAAASGSQSPSQSDPSDQAPRLIVLCVSARPSTNSRRLKPPQPPAVLSTRYARALQTIERRLGLSSSSGSRSTLWRPQKP